MSQGYLIPVGVCSMLLSLMLMGHGLTEGSGRWGLWQEGLEIGAG